MILSGSDFEAMMRRTQATPLKCWKCGGEFTFEQGGLAAIDAGIHGKVKCTSCDAVYETDVQPASITLILDGQVEIFPTP
jgi:hypothetical protein